MLGNIFITIAFASALFASIMYFLNYKGNEGLLKYARMSYHLMITATILASVTLLYLILNHNFQYKYVYSYSDKNLPIGLLISTFYAGQEGSFLFWALCMAILGIFLHSYTSTRGDLEPRVLAVYSLVQSFLLLMITPALKNPFALIYSEPFMAPATTIASQYFNLPFMANYIFSDPATNQLFVKIDKTLVAQLTSAGIGLNEFIINGKGLNPLLHNFWMQIHPPVLFVGFASMSIPFSFAFSALIKNDYREWIKQSLPWTLFGAMVLGLGIMLGGYWAYGVLGWGGYWAWDPVENSSFIPWIVSVAAFHTMLVQKRTANENSIGAFARTNLVLIILSFILVLYSTFLTRSGILGDASVHSFVDPGYLAYLLLIIFMATFIILGGGLIIYRWKYLKKVSPINQNFLSREVALFTGSSTLGAVALVTFLGTSAPILGKSVQIEFYNQMNLPLAIIIGLVNGLSLLLKWKESGLDELLKKVKFSLAASVVSTVILSFFGIKEISMILFTFSSIFALFVNAEIMLKIIKSNFEKIGAYVAHVGLAILFLGVIASSKYDKTQDVNLYKDEPSEVLGYKMTFTGYQPTPDGKYEFEVQIEKDGKKWKALPVMYYSDYNQGIMRNPDIIPFLTKDVYITPVSYDEGVHQHGQTVQIKKGDMTEYENYEVKFVDFDFSEESMKNMMSGLGFSMGAILEVKDKNLNKIYKISPKFEIKDGIRTDKPEKIEELGLTVSLSDLQADNQTVIVKLIHEDENSLTDVNKEFISISASIKPFVGLVWLGTIIIVVGFFISMVRRLKESRS